MKSNAIEHLFIAGKQTFARTSNNVFFPNDIVNFSFKISIFFLNFSNIFIGIASSTLHWCVLTNTLLFYTKQMIVLDQLRVKKILIQSSKGNNEYEVAGF